MKSIRLASIYLAAAFSAAAGTIYSVTDLGYLGGSSAQAFGLNSSGQAAGTATTFFGYMHAFTSSGSGITDLTLNSSVSQGNAAGINDSGNIVGTQYINGQAYASTWTNGTAQSIAGAGSYGMAVNDFGQVAGMFTSDGQGHAFVMSNGSLLDLGTFGGGDWSSAYGINNSGEVAGYGQTASGDFRGFAWTSSGGYDVLGTLGGANSYAMAVGDSGEVVGNAQTGSGYAHAFAWTGGALQDLGTLGGNSSYAYGVNSAGEIVGYSSVAASPVTHAFIDQDGVMIDLNSLIDPSLGWVLTEAYAINGSGEIVGDGLLDGVDHAFRLDLATSPTGEFTAATLTGGFENPPSQTPEPAAITTCLSGLAMIAMFSFVSRLRARLLRHPRDRWQAPPR